MMYKHSCTRSADQNHLLTFVYTYTRYLAGETPSVQSYTVCARGSGHPIIYVVSCALHEGIADQSERNVRVTHNHGLT